MQRDEKYREIDCQILASWADEIQGPCIGMDSALGCFCPCQKIRFIL